MSQDTTLPGRSGETRGPGAHVDPGHVPVQALVCDYAGVVTNPLAEILEAFQSDSGISAEEIGAALLRVAERDGADPFAELEKGRLSEREFLAKMGAAMDGTDRRTALAGFRAAWFAGFRPNTSFIDYLRGIRERGYTLALLTNNVREWEPHWRATVPVEELFELVVNSAHEGSRKPEPAIYTITLERLRLPAQACLFVDDVEENCVTARLFGMPAVLFESTAQAVAEIEEVLAR